MTITFEKFIEILEGVGVCFRTGSPSSQTTAPFDLPPGIYNGLQDDIDLTERLQVACERINAITTTQGDTP